MKIVVFGASGGVGQQVLRRAVAGGHEVTAFVRSPEKLETRAGLNIVVGDAFDAHAVAAAVMGQDAVVSCLSSSKPMKPSDEVTRMVRHIIAGMQAAEIDRITYCASAGVNGELTGAMGKTVMWMLRHALADHRGALDQLEAAGMNTTIARPTSLNNEAFNAAYVETFEGFPLSARAIPRASVADFLVKALEQPTTYSRTSVGLTLPKK